MVKSLSFLFQNERLSLQKKDSWQVWNLLLFKMLKKKCDIITSVLYALWLEMKMYRFCFWNLQKEFKIWREISYSKLLLKMHVNQDTLQNQPICYRHKWYKPNRKISSLLWNMIQQWLKTQCKQKLPTLNYLMHVLLVCISYKIS